MNSIILALGVVLLICGNLDLLWTALWIEKGAGPLTSRLMAVTWRTIKRVGNYEPRVLTVTGPTILLISLMTWITFLWGGWTFVIASSESALLDTLNRGTVSWADYAYFSGYTIFTLGNGDFAPTTGIWQLVTVLASASGLLLITLAVTYVLSVLDAVTQKRSFASDVNGIGSDGTEIVLTSWNGAEFEGLIVSLNSLSTELNILTSNHKAYPVLHYFYSSQVQQAPASQIAVLDEALTLLRFGVTERDRPPELALRPARVSVQNYLNTLANAYISPADSSPPPPELVHLQKAGIPVVSSEDFRKSLATLDVRRRTLLGLVESDVRDWPTTDE